MGTGTSSAGCTARQVIVGMNGRYTRIKGYSKVYINWNLASDGRYTRRQPSDKGWLNAAELPGYTLSHSTIYIHCDCCVSPWSGWWYSLGRALLDWDWLTDWPIDRYVVGLECFWGSLRWKWVYEVLIDMPSKATVEGAIKECWVENLLQLFLFLLRVGYFLFTYCKGRLGRVIDRLHD